ncbi:Transcriptional-regulating factor 1 [Channa argus]|uniref:Transcriptional-regulating factor 1 n=1 Tax=Channa argus TaxID=215402 RepID=A0A6G1QL41_CHAAH|nr:Transcriptional-regulating factor 1 [Channa argus]
MSLPPPVNTDKSGKLRSAAMKEPVQHSGDVYYGMGPQTLVSSHSDSASSSAVYNPEKGPQSLPHYQQAAPVKWMHQDAIQAPNWPQEAPVTGWGQNLTFPTPYMGAVNVRGQMAFHKGVHEGVALPMGGENQLPGPVEVYRDATQAQAQGRGHEWDQHAAVMHQAQLQAYPHGHKGMELQGQPHVPPHTLPPASMLQPFQTTFRPSKPQFSSGFYSVFPTNKAMQSLTYGEQPTKQQQLLHQMQQQQQQQQIRQQQQQQLHQQHQLQLQQQQHMQQQQIQQHQIQQQQIQQMQQQYHQQQLQERQQQIQQMQQQQMQEQSVPQQETTQVQMPPKQQQAQPFPSYPPPEPCPPDTVSKKEDVHSVEPEQEPEAPTCDVSSVSDTSPEKVATNPTELADAQPTAPRRSRRLSREGQSPLGPPSTNIWPQSSKEPPPSQNGVAGAQRGGESQVIAGVIQTTRRRRRASKEINLETLAQKASEMESLPAKTVKEEGPSGKQATMIPLIIPVSVPVHRTQIDTQGGWAQGRLGQVERPAGQTDRKPVIVARRRSIRNSITESVGQQGENDPSLDEDGKSKFKRRPRPEPLIIPPPKPSTFIPPSVYSSITPYQSNLRSPICLPDPLSIPPYTPPPILSPVRGGSGLYFSTFLTNIASHQILPPAPTPKSATRSLLRSTSSEITPPALPLITDAAPVSLEPRINIGQQYQAEIPELQVQPSSQFDEHKADLVWLPVDNSPLKHNETESIEDLMNMACSSVLRGGGTNQELVLHCLHECGGNFLETLERLMLQDPVFPKGHHLTGYHYSGSDSWTAEEKRYFNKGISAYRKDFFLVQKLVQTKTVAQCVEFYYTYKKQVKIGRNGILTFGPPNSPVEKQTETVVEVKGSQQSKPAQGDADGDNKEYISHDQSHDSSHQARVAQSLQAHDYAGTVLVFKEPDSVNKESNPPLAHHRPRAEPAAKKSKVPTKPPQDPDAVFPCKKCSRVFYKVKSRSAHMKSHAEQEKKAAALRQKEEQEQAAAEARARKAAAVAAASAAAAHQGGSGNGVTEQAGVSSQEDSSDGEDDDDEDWH